MGRGGRMLAAGAVAVCVLGGAAAVARMPGLGSGGGPTGAAPTPAAVDPRDFAVVRGDGKVAGNGVLHRYRVEVEKDTGLEPGAVAEEIAAVLADGRGWTHAGAHSFQRTDGEAELVIRVAVPATVDRLCGAYGLRTRGEVNCRAGESVVVNLKRWKEGSPNFPGPVREYRALIVNHEVGHWLGYGHADCPGRGRRAPVMMQQIDGLRGCVANAWPYDADGRYLDGPSVP
ncbi:DUF3152 domain-containing protein [Streptomyces polyrhachis]|uniref:DUF3152 domain-containing protein n=1 Tax=Streptomyces polyrhachis TaxID=1282885 RepID=A0ABW2GHW4_9ACTN